MGAFNSKSYRSKGAKKGEEWTYQLYFDSEADKDTGESHIILNAELRRKLQTLVNVGEPIINIYAYKQDLFWWQKTRFIFFHMFIVFQTKDCWWSIEKNSEGITIQRSTQFDAVKEKYRGVERYKHTLMLDAKGNKTIGELIIWLAGDEQYIHSPNYGDKGNKTENESTSAVVPKDRKENESRPNFESFRSFLNKENQLNKKYGLIFSNCKHFAKEIFNFVAETKRMYEGCPKNSFTAFIIARVTNKKL